MKRRQLGHGAGQAGHIVLIGGGEAVEDHADAQEQRPGADAVVDHVEHRALQADLVHGHQAQHAETQMREGGIRQQAFHVALHPGDHRAVKDADDAENSDDGDQIAEARIIGPADQTDGDHQAEDAVGSELGQHPGQDDRAGRGGFRVSERQPGMQREDRGFDDERAEQSQGNPELRPGRQIVLGVVDDAGHVEGASFSPEINDRRQREDRPGEGVQEEFAGGIPPGPARPKCR